MFGLGALAISTLAMFVIPDGSIESIALAALLVAVGQMASAWAATPRGATSQAILSYGGLSALAAIGAIILATALMVLATPVLIDFEQRVSRVSPLGLGVLFYASVAILFSCALGVVWCIAAPKLPETAS